MFTLSQSSHPSLLLNVSTYELSQPVLWLIGILGFIVFIMILKLAIVLTGRYHDFQAKYQIGNNFFGGSNKSSSTKQAEDSPKKPGQISITFLGVVGLLLFMWMHPQACERTNTSQSEALKNKVGYSYEGVMEKLEKESSTAEVYINQPPRNRHGGDQRVLVSSPKEDLPVEMATIGKRSAPLPNPGKEQVESTTMYSIQLSAYRDSNLAFSKIKEWRERFPTDQFICCEGPEWTRVFVGRYNSLATAQSASQKWGRLLGLHKPAAKAIDEHSCNDGETPGKVPAAR